ncbi:Hypothetical protein PAS_chr4_0722 [Komagataella phaffii GS115]|uniref:RRM domain-containing protein n=2 Tax=Komagataella phaffii TaxID=460519 RepID=C4R8Q8_KOMPG|nr:Hypothetical protein PAS_chr4_0722 [Komagataella phaffii GS115]CAY71983.1 Hypothetical protein PAS_chr4_0722 [Komagataella phaffii GS115]
MVEIIIHELKYQLNNRSRVVLSPLKTIHRRLKITAMAKRVTKPSASSDRRAASGRQPGKYLHSSRNFDSSTFVKDPKTILNNIKRPSGASPSYSPTTSNSTEFKLFVGNLGQDVTEEVLLSSFSKYPSLQNVIVPKEQKTSKIKGYGFVSFASSEDYLNAFKEMNGKYVGQKPITLKRAVGPKNEKKRQGKR